MSALIRKTLLATLLLLLAVGLIAWQVLRASLVDVSGEHRLPGLEGSASVHYDQWQRPFVQADSLADALQVQGWLHARHRLWQMELLRRAGQGRMAELLGRDLLATDLELWRSGVPQLAATLQGNASEATLALVDRYLAGVNRAIDDYTLLPPEFLLLGSPRPRWQRRDVFALGALMAFQSANNMKNELLRLALSQRLDRRHFQAFLTDDSGRDPYPFVLPPGVGKADLGDAMDRLALTDPATNPLMPQLGFGSNGWVVGAQKSASGVPLYAFDSHDELGLPNLFYELHLFFGEGTQLRGWSVPGLPGVINGFNEHIAWGFTNIGDSQDLFLETRSQEDPMLFLDGEQWYRAREERVSIPVKGGEAEELTVLHTRNGPLVSEEPPISLAWTVHRIEAPSLDSLLAFNLAADWQDFTAALDRFPAPTLNATYADNHGTIGFRTGGVLPRRGQGHGLLPLDGSDPAQRWQGLVSPSDMPELADPATGFLAAANARVNAEGDGPLVSADNAAPYRIRRIQEVLAGGQEFSLEDMQALQMDWTDDQARVLLPLMLGELDEASLEETARSVAPLLREWQDNPVAAPASAAALVFQQWYINLAEQVFADKLGELYPRLLRRAYLLNHALDHLLLHGADSPWWRGERGALVSAALNQTVRHLAQQLGNDPATWRLDQVQHVRLEHPLGKAVPALAWLFNAVDEPWGGSVSTVGRARYNYSGPFAVNAGATVRAVAEMAPVVRMASVIPGGQSGHPLSPHYADQYPGWLAGELYPIAPAPGAVEGPTLILKP